MGCDYQDYQLTKHKYVSIHAPVWGATPSIVNPSISLKFQSTHPCGVRHGVLSMLFEYFNVSIHAPVWGATMLFRLLCVMLKFQSTHPCGVRRAGCHYMPNSWVSIHAPVWGATRYAHLDYASYIVSIHAPVWGATTAC